MNISQGAIQRPILTTIIFITIVTLGGVAFSRLPIDLMPDVTYPTVSVSTSYGSVAPEEIEELITRPIEESLAAVQGVQQITSSSTEGQSSVRVSFAWGTDLDVAANDIRDRIDRTMGRLPEDIDSRPMIRKFDLSAFPIMNIGVSSRLDPLFVRKLTEDELSYRLERVPGVAAVDIRGGLFREIHVDLRADKLKALGISTDLILGSLRSENLNVPAGLYDKGNLEVLVRTQGEYISLDDIRNTVITVRQGAPIRIRDVAEVTDSWQEIRQAYRINQQPGIRISVNKQSDVNTVEVAQAVREEIARINRDYPQLNLIPLMDTSRYIKNSISNLGNEAINGGVLAIIVLFFFLRNISSTGIIAIAVPISIIATFMLMYMAGFTLNIMTIGGLALGMGMLMDNSIVVLENIFRHREGGLSATKGALLGTSEVWSAILAGTLTHIVVFLPVLFMQGMSGIMFRQMAYVVSFSMLCSLVVAVTLVPMLASKFMRVSTPSETRKKSPLQGIYDTSERVFTTVERVYGELLLWALGHRKTVLIASGGMFLISLFLVRYIGVELMPAQDESQITVNLEMAVGTRLEVLDSVVKRVEDIVRREVPEGTNMLTQAGGGGFHSSGGQSATITMDLVSRKERKRSSEQVANDLRKSLSGIPGVTIRTRQGQGLFILRMGQQSSDNLNVQIRGYDMATASTLAKQVEKVVQRVPGITDTRISRVEGSPEQIIHVDRQKAADLGLSVAQIGNALQTAVGGTFSSYFRDAGKEYRILVRLSEPDRMNLADLMDLTVLNNRGEQVVLRNVVKNEPVEGPVIIEREDQERIISISANFTGRDMGSIIRDIRAALKSLPLPKDFSIDFGSDYEEQQKAFRELLFAFILALFLVYMVMAGQFESFRDPFIILFAVPMALIGITLTMIATNTIFSMQAFIGCIMLAGIVTNNSILLVHYTNLLRERDGMEIHDAIRLAGSRRLRPILMTSVVTVLGLVPMAMGLGEGGEAQAPMARVVVGGLSSSTLITLILVPIIYSIFEEKLQRKKISVES